MYFISGKVIKIIKLIIAIPDEIDRIIEIGLAYFGISKLVIKKEE
jgi:hypothetical protein